MNGDKLHKGINWTTLVGTATVAALGFVSDQRSGEDDEDIRTATAREFAAYHEWKPRVVADIEDHREQIRALRDAVAALKATADMLSRGRRDGQRIRESNTRAGDIVDQTAPAARSMTDAVIDADAVSKEKRRLYKK